MAKDLNIDCDPWFFSTFVDRCEIINFKQKIGLEDLAAKVDMMLIRINEKYKQHSIINTQPHVFIKANNGTFGMGIMVVFSGEDILNINKKNRHSMSILKQGVDNNDVVIQEGIQTSVKIFDAPAENILYSINNELVKKLIRYNRKKSNSQSLNAVGMEIESSDEINIVDNVIAALANLTVQIESKQLIKNL